jgi:hypothetical protein
MNRRRAPVASDQKRLLVNEQAFLKSVGENDVN